MEVNMHSHFLCFEMSHAETPYLKLFSVAHMLEVVE
jgi:hypothetical protein